MTTLPRLIALCGHPQHGKTTAAEILRDGFGYVIADDGLPLRRIAVNQLGLTWEQVTTQDGKAGIVQMPKGPMTVREVLGEIGNAFEEKLGADIIPMMTHRTFEPGVSYVMGSVRRQQGLYWRRQGALVIEIVCPGRPRSPHLFDHYDPDAVMVTVVNELRGYDLTLPDHAAAAREQLAAQIVRALGVVRVAA